MKLKICLVLCVCVFGPVSYLYAQEGVWQLELEASGEKPVEWWNKRKSGYIADFEQAVMETFQPNGKKIELQEQLILSKDRTKASNFYTKSFTYYQYPEKLVFSFLEGDDMIMKDQLSDIYKVTAPSALSDLKDGEAYLIIGTVEGTKELRGYTCNKYTLTFGEMGLGENQYTVWCAAALPAYSTEVLPFGRHLPGAIFQLDFSKEDSTLGFFVTKAEKLPTLASYFELPNEVEVVELTPLDSDGTGQGDESLVNSFHSAFSLEDGIQWFQDARAGLSVVGVRNENGDILLPAVYQSAERINENVVAVTDIEQRYWLMNAAGQLLNKVAYNHFLPIDDAIYSYQTDAECGLANLDGQILVGQLEDIQPLNSTYVFAKKGGQYGVMDLKGNFVLAPTYHKVKWNSNGELNLLEKNGDAEMKTVSASEFLKEIHK